MVINGKKTNPFELNLERTDIAYNPAWSDHVINGPQGKVAGWSRLVTRLLAMRIEYQRCN